MRNLNTEAKSVSRTLEDPMYCLINGSSIDSTFEYCRNQDYFCHMVLVCSVLLIGAIAMTAQTYVGSDSLYIRSSKSRSTLVPQADTNVTLGLPRASGTIALESNGISSAASTGTAIAYVADTTITGGGWITVAEIKVDSGKGGILEYYFHAVPTNPVRLQFSGYCISGAYQLIDGSDNLQCASQNQALTCGGPFPRFPICLPGVDEANWNQNGWLVGPFQYLIETTCSGSLLEHGEGAIYRSGFLNFLFQPQARLQGNIDLQNNYQLARLNTNTPDVASDIWHKQYVIIPTSSGVVRLKFRNYRGNVARGVGTVADCCGNVIVPVNSNIRLQKLRLMLH